MGWISMSERDLKRIAVLIPLEAAGKEIRQQDDWYACYQHHQFTRGSRSGCQCGSLRKKSKGAA
jgi:hypothetical protein